MKDETFISERQALSVLMQDGDYTESQARIILGHSRKMAYDGGNYYPMSYIYKRADEGKNRQDEYGDHNSMYDLDY